MAGYFTYYGASRALTAGLGQGQAAAAGMYLGLATWTPLEVNLGEATLAQWAAVELTTGGYARQAVTWGAPSGEPRQIANSATVNFGAFAQDPPEVSACFLCDVASGTTGNVLAYWSLDTARDAQAGGALDCAPGSLSLGIIC